MKSFRPSCPPQTTLAFMPEADLLAGRPIGAGLKALFDTVTHEPMPDRLLKLADALEEAFQRGELFEPPVKLNS